MLSKGMLGNINVMKITVYHPGLSEVLWAGPLLRWNEQAFLLCVPLVSYALQQGDGKFRRMDRNNGTC